MKAAMKVQTGFATSEMEPNLEEWRTVELAELITEFHGGAPLKPSDFTDSGIKVLPKGAVGRAGWLRIDEKELQYCSKRYAASHLSNQVDQSYTIVVLRDLVPSGPSIGLMVKIKEPETYVLAQGVYGFKLNEHADAGYLVQLSNTSWYRQLMNSIMVGSTQVHITNTAFKRIKVTIPPPREQSAISETLYDADALIESLERLIIKKRAIKQGAMQQLLTGRKRLPGFNGNWKAASLGDLCYFENGDRGANYPSKSDFKQSGFPFVNAGHVDDGKISIESMDHISRSKFDSLRGGKYKAGDILFCLRGSLGKFGVAHADTPPGAIASSLIIIRTKAAFSRTFLIAYLKSHLCKSMIELWAGGAAQPNLGGRDLGKFEILLPPTTEEQEEIGSILSTMDAEIDLLETKLIKARGIKQGMMQVLLTGKVRLV